MFEDNKEWPGKQKERACFIQDKLLDVVMTSDLVDATCLGKAVFLAYRGRLMLESMEDLEEIKDTADFFLAKIVWCLDYYKANPVEALAATDTAKFWDDDLSELPTDQKERQEVLAQNRRTNEVITKLLVEVEQNAITDVLTGLSNRRHFEQMLDSMVERANRYDHQSFTLLLIDIDHFKKFNDTYGHQTGDDALRVVSELLKDALRKTDVASRFGGEEFACLLPLTSVVGGVIFAERLRKEIENFPFIVEIENALDGYRMNHVAITVSIGICEYRPGQRTSDLIQQADEALYVAKDKGRNRIEVAE